MAQVRIKFVPERVARPSPTCAGWISPLRHKVFDYTVENGIVVIAFTGKEDQIIYRTGHFVCKQLNYDFTQIGLESSGIFLLNPE